MTNGEKLHVVSGGYGLDGHSSPSINFTLKSNYFFREIKLIVILFLQRLDNLMHLDHKKNLVLSHVVLLICATFSGSNGLVYNDVAWKCLRQCASHR